MTDGMTRLFMAYFAPLFEGKLQPTIRPFKIYRARTIIFDYVNYKGVKRTRRVIPETIEFKSTPYHPEVQWILNAYDLDIENRRSFAMKDMTNVKDATP